ncbi:unnamed protein product [Protopolystoma xenopodis]|uniref:Uncharacterized protein n=1 Tax=Protopolystoma xenopodis TaxID=117903 RepID=A0A3S5CRD7_9PLAT|nr:unnamed protein product [Protopolystoma xenopodis]
MLYREVRQKSVESPVRSSTSPIARRPPRIASAHFESDNELVDGAVEDAVRGGPNRDQRDSNPIEVKVGRPFGSTDQVLLAARRESEDRDELSKSQQGAHASKGLYGESTLGPRPSLPPPLVFSVPPPGASTKRLIRCSRRRFA